MSVPGLARGTTHHRYLVHVTLNVSLSCDHFVSIKPAQGPLQMTFHWANHSVLWSPCRGSEVPIGSTLIIQAAPSVMENMVSLFHPSCVKTFTWKICFLHLAIVVTQLSNLSCPGNTTAMNTLLSREESIGFPVTFHRLQRGEGRVTLNIQL